MQLTKGAIGNLINRYKAVLKKCYLLNVFGSLAVAGMLVMGVADAAEAKYALDGAAYDVTVISDTELSFAPSGVAAGETRGSDDIIGGNWQKEGTDSTIASTFITLKGNGEHSYNGELIGGSLIQGAGGTTTVTGDTHISIEAGAKIGGVSYGKYNNVIGGGKTNGAGTSLVLGTAHVTVAGEVDGTVIGGGNAKKAITSTENVRAETAATDVHITDDAIVRGVVGGGVSDVYGAGTVKGSATTHVGTATTTIDGGTISKVIEPSTTNELNASVIGGGIASGEGATASVDTAVVNITGGTFEGNVHAGSAAIKGGEATVTNTVLNITGGKGTIGLKMVYTGGLDSGVSGTLLTVIDSLEAGTFNKKVQIIGGSRAVSEDTVIHDGRVEMQVSNSALSADVRGGGHAVGNGTTIDTEESFVYVSNSQISGNESGVSTWTGRIFGAGIAEGPNTSIIHGTTTVIAENVYGVTYDKDTGEVTKNPGGRVYGGGQAWASNDFIHPKVTIDSTHVIVRGKDTALDEVIGGTIVSGTSTSENCGLAVTGHTDIRIEEGKVDTYVVGGNTTNWFGRSVIGTKNENGAYEFNGVRYDAGSTHVTISGGDLSNATVMGGSLTDFASNDTGTVRQSVVFGSTEVNVSGGAAGIVLGGGMARYSGSASGPDPDLMPSSTVQGSTHVRVSGGEISNVIGAGMASSTTTLGAIATVKGTSLVEVNGGLITNNVIGGGLALGQATADLEGTAQIAISNGTIKGNVYAGGYADGDGLGSACAAVDQANMTISGGTIEGNVYAGGAALNGGTADIGDFDVRITGGTIKGNVVAGNDTGDTGASTFTLLGASLYSGGSFKGSIIIGGDATIGGGVVINTNDTTVTVDGMDTTVSNGYESKGNNNTLAFSNYIGDFSSVATGFDTLSAAGGSHVKMDYLSTGPKADDQTGFFAGADNFNVTGEGTVTVKNVTATDGKTITVVDGGTLEADTLTTKGDTGGSAKTDGLGSTLIIGNSDLTSIAANSLSSTAGSEIKFTGLADGTALNDITGKLATGNTGIVNVGDTKVTELNGLVKADGTVAYSDWKAAGAAGITNNELKHATMTEVQGTDAEDEASDELNGVAVSGIKLNSDNAYIGIHHSSNVTLTGLGGGENFVSRQDGSTGGILLWNGDNTVTLGDNAYTGSKKVTYIGFGGGKHTVNALGQDRNASRIIVTMGINGDHTNASVVNASHVTLQVEKTIGDFNNPSADHHLSVNADAANVLAGDHILVGSLSLKNGSLVQAGKDIVISGAAGSNLSGQGMVDAGQTLTLAMGYTGAEDDDLLLTGKKLDAKAAIDSTKGTLAIVTDELVTGGDTTLVDDTLVADNADLGGALNASGESLVVVQNFAPSAGGTTPGALDQAVSVTDQSLMVYGAGAEQAQQAVAETGHTGAAYYAGKTLELTTNGSLTVGTVTTAPTAPGVAFGNDSLLVVDGAAMNGQSVFTGPTAGGATASVDAGSKLHVDNAVAGGFTVFGDSFIPPVTGWANENVTTDSAMLDASYSDNKVTVTTNDAHHEFPNLSHEMAQAVNNLYNGKLNNVASDQMGVRFLSRATNDHYLGTDKDAAASTIESAARIAFAGAVPQMTKMASDAATNAVVNRLGFANPADGAQAMNAEGQIVDRHTTGFALWIAPLWQNQHGWGMEAGNLDYGFNGNLGGVSLGADYTFENAIRAGITFNIGGGYAETSGGDLSNTRNNMNFWGLGAYAGWNYENFALMADVSYTSTWNDLQQDMDSRMGMGDLEADVQASAISAGLRAEYKLETSVLDVIPHIGVRYMSLNTWGFDAESNGGTVLEGDGFHQDIWTFPVGVTFTKDFTLDSGWTFKPSIDFSVIPAAGDIKAKQDVAFTGAPAVAEMETQMMDYLTWQGGVGLEMGNDTMSFGVNYTLQAGQHTTGHGVFGNFRYEF